uniref:Uncharacterized protein n=1 Tax=Globodera rostochiensis TaxID=31243 RepID=A0A914HMA3_GLORO
MWETQTEETIPGASGADFRHQQPAPTAAADCRQRRHNFRTDYHRRAQWPLKKNAIYFNANFKLLTLTARDVRGNMKGKNMRQNHLPHQFLRIQ